MIPPTIVRSTFLGLAVLTFLAWAPAQQSGQSGGSGGSTGSSGGRVAPAGGSRTGSRSRANPNSASSQQRQQPALFISGSVVLEDGAPPPAGAVIERVCFGRAKKEAYVDSKGNFGFQVGANTIGNAIFDATEDTAFGQSAAGSSSARSFGLPSRSSPPQSMEFVGCELRARLAGYRSSAVILTGGQTLGPIDVGTIVLHPVAKVTGTTVSATGMQAPKDAKKAMARAEEAVQKQKFDEAEKNLAAAVAAFPRYATAWFALGRLYRQKNRSEDARQAFSKALEADGNYVNPYIELARLSAVERKWQEVADLTDRALALDPLDFPEGFYLNALANYSLGKPDAAERSARKAQRLDTLHRIPHAHLLLAGLLQVKNDAAGEAEQLRIYLKYAPQADNAAQIRSRLQELETSGIAAVSPQPDRR